MAEPAQGRKPHRDLKKRIRRSDRLAAFAFCTATLLFPTAARAQNKTTAGEFTIERPTLVSLGFEWRISGDANRNASVDVTFRKKGDAQWRKGLPLLRLDGEQVTSSIPRGGSRHYFSYVAPNMFAGSLLNLQPDTEYECRFVLSDPDGVKGRAVRTVTVRTRNEPESASGGHVYNVYPFDYKGPKQQPAFTGLLAAYYMGSDESDHSNVMPPRVQPGDIILVHAGVYKDNRFNYGGFDRSIAAYGTPFDGTYYLTASGTPDKPIVIKGAGDGEVIFDGDGNQTLFNLMAANYNYFEGITVRNTNVAFLLGYKDIAGSSGFTLKHCRLYDVGRGVQDEWSGSKDFYIADNVFIGRHNPERLQSWWRADVWAKFPGYPALITSEYAIKIYGQGHVVAYNYVANWHDGIDVATYGDPDGTPNENPDRVPVSIDFYNNDIYNMADNCIEADGGAHNIRVFRNRCFNSAGGALSAQPTFGGPLYFYQNVVYDTTTGGPLKLIDTPAGVLIYQNTLVGEGRLFGPAANVHFLNNLILGDGWAGPIFNLSTSTNYSSSDYNGYRPNPGAEDSFEWNSPPFGVFMPFGHGGGEAQFEPLPPGASPGQLVPRHFQSLDEYREETGQEKHSVLVDYDVFENVKMPDKSDPQRLYNPEDVDFQLRPGSGAVDAGVLLPTINDDFTGRAPDLGAYELGRPIPQYGPRTEPLGEPGPGAPRSETGPPPAQNPE